MTNKQTFADWFRDHAIFADSLDPEAPLDDLEALREVVGDARVVAIGESSHYVREFYLLRHRLLRFLAERCGFTVYAMEAPFSEAHAIDDWIQDGTGTVAEVATSGVAFDQGRSKEMHDHLEWMRAYNHTSAPTLRFTGTDVPGSGGSPLTAIEEVAAYLRRADPGALPLLKRAIDLARKYHDTATFKAISRYTTLEPDAQDALTATLSRLLARMETTGDYQRSQGREREHATALHHLRGVWYLDHFHRDLAGRGVLDEHPHALHDLFMSEPVLRLLENGTPDTRIVLACHNVHIQKNPISRDGFIGPFPLGYHLAQALGDDYVAIAATSNRGRAARMTMNPERPLGFEVQDRPLPPPVDASIESAFATEAPLAIADLRTARSDIRDAQLFQRMRMEDYFMDAPVFDAFDAMAYIPHTSCTEYVTEQSESLYEASVT